MQNGRLIYIEPNDIVKDTLKLYDTSHKNFTWNPEDLNIYVDLQVICPSRNDCGEEQKISENGTYNNEYISLMEGTKIGNGNFLTTDFTNISYSEIKNNNVSSKEALGITSIDITFDAHFYPKVTINFTDVRAYSLFMPAEEEYKEQLKTEAYESLDKEGNRQYHERGRVYTNFFNAVFHFPYPRFLLTVKGFYGTKVTFILAVETFKSSLNSNTGNFDVSISFIGYMYGIYTDIPMNYVMCAPYLGELDYSDSGTLIKSKYWNDKVKEGIFKTKDGETIPTFLELAKNYTTAMSSANQNPNLGENFTKINNAKFLKTTVEEIIQKLDDLFLDDFGYTTDVDSNKQQTYKHVINDTENKKYAFYIFLKNDDTSNIEVTWSTDKAKALSELITKTNSTYADILGNKTIPTPWLCTYLPSESSKISGEVLGKLEQVVKVKTENDKQVAYIVEDSKINTFKIKDGNDTTYGYQISEDDSKILQKFVQSNIQNGIAKDLSKYYFCAINLPELIGKLNEITKECEKISNNTQQTATTEVEKYLSQALGFTPNIENIFRMVFAHLQCFFNEFLTKTIYKIKDSNRKIKDFKPVLDNTNTDVKYKSKTRDAFLPPFFAFFEIKGEEQQKQVAYPNMYDIPEIKFVENLINASKQFGEQYNKLVQEIEALSTPSTPETEEPPLSTGLDLSIAYNGGFEPSSYYDAFYGDMNPYSWISKSSKTYIQEIFYAFSIRMYALTMLNVNRGKIDTIISNEVANIISVFPELSKNEIEKFFKDIGKDEFTTVSEFSKKRIFPIENMIVPITTSYDDIDILEDKLLLTRDNLSTEYGDAERESHLDTYNQNTFDYLKGIKIVNTSDFEVFSGLTSKVSELHENIVYNNIKYILDNKQAACLEIHKLYRRSEDKKSKLQFTDENVNHLAEGDERNTYTLPFILWGIPRTIFGGKVQMGLTYDNLLFGLGANEYTIYDPEFGEDKKIKVHELEDAAKAFYILASIIVDISAIRKSFDSDTNLNIGGAIADGNDLFFNKITRTRRIIPLFYGCLLYLLRRKMIDGKDVVPYLFDVNKNSDGTIKLDGSFKVNYDYRDKYIDGVINDNSGVYKPFSTKDGCNIKTLILHLLVAVSKVVRRRVYKNNEFVYENCIYRYTSANSLKNQDIIDIYNSYGDGNFSDLENYFLSSIQPGGIIKNILDNAKKEYSQAANNKVNIGIYYNKKGDDRERNLGEYNVYPDNSETSKSVVRLVSEVVCMISTNYRTNDLTEGTTKKITFAQQLKKDIETFKTKLYSALSGTTTATTTETTLTHSSNTSNLDVQCSLYYTLKNLYDKWICSYGNMDRFTLRKPKDDSHVINSKYKKGLAVNNICELNNFVFVDSIYRDIGKTFLCDPASLLRVAKSAFDGDSNFSFYQFLHAFCVDNKLLMRALPVYNNFYTEEGLKEIFTPLDPFNINQAQSNGFSSTYLIMYTHQSSAHLDNERSSYINDGMDIGRTIITTDTLKLFNGEGYPVPTFGVTYGMQNQSYFKGININMDNPMTTDYSIANTFALTKTAVSGGDLNIPMGIGQNIYSIYSNRSYNCTVEMMGCVNIMPMMYFQLNNIPMFKGAYMITSVKHSIKAGNMTTTFTGVRQTSIIYPFINGSLILSSMLDRSNGPIVSNTTLLPALEGQIPNVAQLTPKVYTDLSIINGSLLDQVWMMERREAYHKKNPSVALSPLYWGKPLKSGSLYPLTLLKSRKIQYIILHYTAGVSSGKDKAISMRNGWFSRWMDGVGASADFGVDDYDVVQFTPDISKYAGWSCGGNRNGISIEMCSTFSGDTGATNKKGTKLYDIPNVPQWTFTDKVLENTKKLIIEIFKEIGPVNITTHYRRDQAAKKTSPKPCPGIYGWNCGGIYDEKGQHISPRINDETKLKAYVDEIWNEWVRVSGVSPTENKIQLV